MIMTTTAVAVVVAAAATADGLCRHVGAAMGYSRMVRGESAATTLYHRYNMPAANPGCVSIQTSITAMAHSWPTSMIPLDPDDRVSFSR